MLVIHHIDVKKFLATMSLFPKKLLSKMYRQGLQDITMLKNNRRLYNELNKKWSGRVIPDSPSE